MKYEFPGGKIKKNETEVIALKRELKEELDLDIDNYKKYFKTSHKYDDFEVDVSFYISILKNLNFKLNFHDEYKILRTRDLKKLIWLEADYSVINHIQKYGLC